MSETGECQVLDSRSLKRKLARREKWCADAVFHPTKARLLAREVELFTYLDVWDIEMDGRVGRFMLPGQATKVVPRPDGRRLALLSEFDVLYVADAGASVTPSSDDLPAPQLRAGAVLKGHLGSQDEISLWRSAIATWVTNRGSTPSSTGYGGAHPNRATRHSMT